MRKTFAFLGALATAACHGFPGTFDQGVQDFTRGAQGVAVATGQPWAVPLIGGAGALATAVYHAVYGVPGVKAIPGTRAHRKRAARASAAAHGHSLPGVPPEPA